MPAKPPVIVPVELLVMPPANVDHAVDEDAAAVEENRLLVPTIVPALEMPPVNVGPWILIAPAAATALVPSSEMPPVIVPLSAMPPWIVLPLVSAMPFGLIVPLLVIVLVTVELLMAIAVIAVELVQPGAVVLL